MTLLEGEITFDHETAGTSNSFEFRKHEVAAFLFHSDHVAEEEELHIVTGRRRLSTETHCRRGSNELT